jgi:hypothetical protein
LPSGGNDIPALEGSQSHAINLDKSGNSQICQKPSSAGSVDRRARLRHRYGMTQGNSITGVIKVLSCLVVAFALAFFPPASAHAGMGVHGDHSNVTQSAGQTVELAHTHAAAQMDCGTSTEKSSSDAGLHQCCAGLCMAAILIDGFAPPLADATRLDPVMLHSTLVAAESHGFLRPPKHLI